MPKNPSYSHFSNFLCVFFSTLIFAGCRSKLLYDLATMLMHISSLQVDTYLPLKGKRSVIINKLATRPWSLVENVTSSQILGKTSKICFSIKFSPRTLKFVLYSGKFYKLQESITIWTSKKWGANVQATICSFQVDLCPLITQSLYLDTVLVRFLIIGFLLMKSINTNKKQCKTTKTESVSEFGHRSWVFKKIFIFLWQKPQT